MRILFKTSYLDDIRLFQHSGQTFWYGLLVRLPAAGSVRARGFLRRRVLLRFHPGDRRRRADAADRLYGARQPRARRLHGDRRLHQHLSHHQGRPVPHRLSRRRARSLAGRRPHCGAGQPHDGHLPGDRHAGLLPDRRAARDPLGIGDPRLPGNAGAGARDLRSCARQALGVLLLLPRHSRSGGACRHQSDAITHGPRDGGDPRLRDLGAKPRRQSRAATRPSPSR